MVRAVIAGLVAGLSVGSEALAGAWPQPEGQLIVIVTSGRKMAPIEAFAGAPAESDKNTSQIFAEYGAWNDLTVGMTVYGEFSTTDDVLEARIGGHARYRVWRGQVGDVLSVQAGASFPVERWFGGELSRDRPDSATEVDMRVLYGRGWQTGWGDSFVSGELGLRVRAEDLDDEVRLDLTAGHTPMRGLLGLFSVFTTVPLGDDGDAALKLAPSVAYTLWPGLGPNDKKPQGPLRPNTVQLGLVWDALAADEGMTLALSVWKRF